MMDFEGEGVRFGSGNRAKQLCFRIATDGERDTLREEMPYFCGSEPLGLRRFPVKEVEIGILGVFRRRALRLLVLQLAHDERPLLLVHRQPQALTSAEAVVELFFGGIEMPEINECWFHNLECKSDRPPEG